MRIVGPIVAVMVVVVALVGGFAALDAQLEGSPTDDGPGEVVETMVDESAFVLATGLVMVVVGVASVGFIASVAGGATTGGLTRGGR